MISYRFSFVFSHGAYVGKEKPTALKSCEAECAEMLKKGELKGRMDLESCVKALCRN